MAKPAFERKLDELEEAAASTSGARVLDALLAAWRERRLASLAEGIEALSARYEQPAISGKTERARYEHWLDVVSRKRNIDLPRILAELPSATVIRARDHVERLASLEPDPRVAGAMLDHVKAERFNLHNTVWTGIFRELKRHGDVRTRAALAALPEQANEGFRARIASAVAALPESLPESADDSRRIAAVRAAIPGLRLDEPREAPRKAAPTRDEAALFADMLASPDDDDVRLVLADVYAERGDVRGELIQLQIKNTRASKPAAKDVKHEKEILKKHLVDLLGPVEPVVDRKTCVFSRGFLAHAEVKLKTKEQRRELLGHPLLSTLESIVSRDVELVSHPSMRALRAIEGMSWKGFVELAHGKPLPNLRRVVVVTQANDPAGTPLERLEGLPALEEVSFESFGNDGQWNQNSWSWILAGASGALGVGRKLGLVTDLYRGKVSDVLAALDRHPNVTSFRLSAQRASDRPAEVHLELERTKGGWRAVMTGRDYSLDAVGSVFAEPRRVDLTVELHPPHKNDPLMTPRGMEFLREALGDRMVLRGA